MELFTGEKRKQKNKMKKKTKIIIGILIAAVIAAAGITWYVMNQKNQKTGNSSAEVVAWDVDIEEEEPSEEKGILEISAETGEENICFTVEDNGAGMTQQRVKEVLEFSGTSIGVANTDRRIKILYGEAYGVSLHSQLGEGTAVVVTIPK